MPIDSSVAYFNANYPPQAPGTTAARVKRRQLICAWGAAAVLTAGGMACAPAWAGWCASMLLGLAALGFAESWLARRREGECL